MRALALTRYDSLGSSSRIRFYQYIPSLTSLGMEIQVAPFLGNDYVRNLYTGKHQPVLSVVKAYIHRIACLLNNHHFDLLWIEKELFPWLPILAENLFLRRGIPSVIDYDDAAFHRYDQYANRLIRALLGKKIDAIMHQATTVVVGNEYLAERAGHAGARSIEYLPSVVDINRYKMSEKTGEPFRIGWIGSPVTAPYLGLIRDALVEVTKKTGARLVLVGAGDQDPLPGVAKDVLPWSEQSEVAQIQSFDVGIMPLPDGPFEQGKSGYKLIQYMACGLPAVASPVGANKRIVEQGETGFLASNTSDWVEALTRLSADAVMRAALGKAGRKKVEQEYSLQVAAPRLLGILTGAASRKKNLRNKGASL
jgi:glycosyltransferase involved in cell wall biosynthesis